MPSGADFSASTAPPSPSSQARSELVPQSSATSRGRSKRRPLQMIGGLLEGVRGPQREILVVLRSDELQADRQAVAREAAGHRQRGLLGEVERDS